MVAWFIMKDGKVIGKRTGYKKEITAIGHLPFPREYNKMWHEHYEKYKEYQGAEELPDDLKNSGIFSQHPVSKKWYIDSDYWERNVFRPYFSEHYKICEREYEIVFKD